MSRMKLYISFVLLVSMVCYGSALVCYECSNVTAQEQKDCGKPVNQTCDVGYNGCVVALYHFKSVFVPGGSYQMSRNCSSKCNEDDNCNQMNKTAKGELLGCKAHCCQGDRCNLNFPLPTTQPPTTSSVQINVTTPMARQTTSPTTFPETTAFPGGTETITTTTSAAAVPANVFSGFICSALLFGLTAAHMITS